MSERSQMTSDYVHLAGCYCQAQAAACNSVGGGCKFACNLSHDQHHPGSQSLKTAGVVQEVQLAAEGVDEVG